MFVYLLGENRTNEDFVSASPYKTVPAIDNNGFKLFERSVILLFYEAVLLLTTMHTCTVALLY